MKPKISVIIPVFNEEKHIIGCLKSLKVQSLKPVEIIVVDDGSSDNSKLKVQNAKSQLKIKNLIVLSQNHKGAGAARNLGVTQAQGNILVFIDADMEFDKNFLKNLTLPIVNKESKGTFSKDEIVKNWHNPWARSWNYCIGLKTKKAIPENYPDTAPVFRAILKSEFKKAQGFDETRGYDDDWSLSEKLGYQATVAPKAIYYHYNPDSFGEIFRQARWCASRKYKYGKFGQLLFFLWKFFFKFRLIRTIKYGYLPFFIASIAYDYGILVGIIRSSVFNKTNK